MCAELSVFYSVHSGLGNMGDRGDMGNMGNMDDMGDMGDPCDTHLVAPGNDRRSHNPLH